MLSFNFLTGLRFRSQIRKLYISVGGDFYTSNPRLDQLKAIDDFIRGLSANLEKFSFTWAGKFKGLCPLSLGENPLLPSTMDIHFPKLQYMQVRNAAMTSTQLSDLVATHCETVKRFNFESVELLSISSWDDALAPLLTDSSGRVWSRISSMSDSGSSQALRANPRRRRKHHSDERETGRKKERGIQHSYRHRSWNLHKHHNNAARTLTDTQTPRTASPRTPSLVISAPMLKYAIIVLGIRLLTLGLELLIRAACFSPVVVVRAMHGMRRDTIQ